MRILLVLAILVAVAVAESEERRADEDEGYEFHEPAARVKRWSKTMPKGRRPKRETDKEKEGFVEEFDDTPIDPKNHPEIRVKRWSKTHKRGERPKRQAPPPAALPPAGGLPQPIIPGPPLPAPPPHQAVMVPGAAAQAQAESVAEEAKEPPKSDEGAKANGNGEVGSETQVQEPSIPQQRAKRGAIFATFERVKRRVD